MSDAAAQRPDGIDGSALPGPFPVGVWAKGFQEFLRERPRVQLFGEVWNLQALAREGLLRAARRRRRRCRARSGATGSTRSACPTGALADGAQVVVAGGPDYYPGSRTASPGFSFDVTGLRIAGEGDLLAQLADAAAAARRRGAVRCPRRRCRCPRCRATIGVVTGEGGKARDDVLAGAAAPRLGRAARVGVRAGAGPPRGAARSRARSQDLAAIDEVDVDHRRARRRLARRPVRVLRRDALPHRRAAARAGDRQRRPPHRPDADRRRRGRQLLDADARRRGRRPAATSSPSARGPARAARALDAPRAPRRRRARARPRAALARVPGEHVARHRREPAPERCASCAPPRRRRIGERRADAATRALVLAPQGHGGRRRRGRWRRRRAVEGLALALTAHDPRRVLERGYAMVDDRAGGARDDRGAGARRRATCASRFADGSVDARIEDAGA